MGKSVLAYSQVVDGVERSFAEFRRALPKEDKQRFDRLFNLARRHTPGGVLLADPDPFRPIIMGMLIELMGMIDHGAADRRHVV